MKLSSSLLVLAVFVCSNFLTFGFLNAQEIGDEIILEEPVALSSLPENTNPTAQKDLEVIANVDYHVRGLLTTTIESTATELMDIQSEEKVDIQAILPPDFAGQDVTLEALDGGTAELSGLQSTVDDQGLVPLSFTAGTKPGLYRVVVKTDATRFILKFWVPDPADASSNPEVVTPAP
jgi:hypothetical protein